jgi:hypothetical protein
MKARSLATASLALQILRKSYSLPHDGDELRSMGGGTPASRRVALRHSWSDASFAWDINADGIISGSVADPNASDNPNPVKLLAVIWQDEEIVNLNDFIPADSGWVLAQAYGINDKGRIVGFGYNKGRQRGFVLSPVES